MADKSHTLELTADQAREVLRYAPDTGKLFWRERRADLFKKECQARSWNKRFSGKEAFTATEGRGYFQGVIFGQRCLSHRVIWLIQTGEWPTADVDHINGHPSDNSWKNLRAVTRAENLRNKHRNINNTSGVNGVVWLKSAGKWTASIWVDSRRIYLGLFTTIEAAAEARQAANRKYGFSERHGT